MISIRDLWLDLIDLIKSRDPFVIVRRTLDAILLLITKFVKGEM